MNTDALKKIYEGLPYAFKAPFSSFIRNRITGNKVYLEQYSKLEKLDDMSIDEQEKEQQQLLRDTLIHAYEHTKYYHELFDKIEFDPYGFHNIIEIKRIPVLTKDVLKSNFEDLCADDVSSSYTVATGGTSGSPTTVQMSNEAYYREQAFIYHFWSKFGYDYKKSRLATFRGVKMGDKICEINPMYQEIRMNPFLMNRNNISDYWKKINKYGADFIYGYPSAIYNFCKLANQACIKLKGAFKAVLLISENLYPFQEEVIRESLDCPIAMFYGHSERAVFGEKIDKGYVFNPLYGFTEISKNNEPIVTGFINKKMPLIRYLVDDTVRPIDDGEYEVEGHRDSSVIYGKDGSELRASLVDFHGILSQQIGSFQLVQDVPGELLIRVINENKRTQQEIENIRCECESRLGSQFRVMIDEVDALETSQSSTRKYKLLIQNCVGGGVILGKQYTIVGHRDSEVLYGLNGEEISAAAINFHDRTFEKVEAYQFIQEKKGKCILYIKTESKLDAKEFETIERSVNYKLGAAIQCDIKETDQICCSGRGKYRMIIQRINKSEA